MLLLKTTSVAGLVSALSALNSDLNSNTNALSVLNNPDDTVAGSVAKALKDGKTYTDTVFAGIDIPQVTANKNAITLLNNTDNTVDGSIAKVAKTVADDANVYADTKKAEVIATIQTTQDAINIINGADTVDGSINKSIKDVIGGAPAEFDTLKEIADKLGSDESIMGALTSTVTDNKTAAEQALADHIAAYNTDKDAIATKFTDERTQTTSDIADAIAANNASTDGKYFQIANNFSEITSTADKATARTNLGAVSIADVDAFAEANKDLFKQETLTINSGIVTLDSAVAVAHIDFVHINHPNNEYDTPVFVSGANAGEFKIYDSAEGDLDGTDVEIKYVQQQL